MKKISIYFLLGLTLVFFYTASWAIEGNYRIGPGDVVEISVWEDESLIRELVIPPDSVIAFPLVGDIDTMGMTVAELRKIVTNKLSGYVSDATVTVMIRQINSLKAYVIGKVNNPGGFNITMDTSVIQILAMAGGLNPFASASNIYILRRKKNIPVKIPFNYKQIEKGENLAQDILLQKGDVIVVP